MKKSTMVALGCGAVGKQSLKSQINLDFVLQPALKPISRNPSSQNIDRDNEA